MNSTYHYIKRQYNERQVQQIFGVLGVLHNICNMCGWDLPDMSALALGCCALSDFCVHIRQIPPAHVTYIAYT